MAAERLITTLAALLAVISSDSDGFTVVLQWLPGVITRRTKPTKNWPLTVRLPAAYDVFVIYCVCVCVCVIVSLFMETKKGCNSAWTNRTMQPKRPEVTRPIRFASFPRHRTKNVLPASIRSSRWWAS